MSAGSSAPGTTSLPSQNDAAGNSSSRSRHEGATSSEAVKRPAGPELPPYSLVVKKGRPQRGLEKAADGNATGRARRPGAVTVIGTSAVSSIKTVQSKLVSVFASRFSPDLDADTLAEYLGEKLNRKVSCQKIVSAQRRFGSFKVSAECKEVGEMYAPELWPEGAFVRRYYEARRPANVLNGPAAELPA